MDPHAASTEAERWLEIAGKLLAARDFIGSKTFAIRARESDPGNPLSDKILVVVDTLLAAEKRVNSGYDWYAILQLAHLVRDPDLIAAQYRRLVLLLNPDRNRLPFADFALRLVVDAWSVLSDPAKKWLFDNELSLFLQRLDQSQQLQQQSTHLPNQVDPAQVGPNRVNPVRVDSPASTIASASGINTFQFFQLPQQPEQLQQPQQEWFFEQHHQQRQQQPKQLQERELLQPHHGHRHHDHQPVPAAAASQLQLPQRAKPHQPFPQQLLQQRHHKQLQKQPDQQRQPKAIDQPKDPQIRPQPQQPAVEMQQAPQEQRQLPVQPPLRSQRLPEERWRNENAAVNDGGGEERAGGVMQNDAGQGDNVDAGAGGPGPRGNGNTDSSEVNVDSFWTACPYCYYMYEYAMDYQDCILKCQNCRRGFHALQIPNPPFVQGKETSFCCWGFFPLGFSMTSWKKNKLNSFENSNGFGGSNWFPFSPMFPSPVKENGFGRKNTGRKIVYLDDDFLDDSDSSEDYDSSDDWDSNSNSDRKKRKGKSVGVGASAKPRGRVGRRSNAEKEKMGNQNLTAVGGRIDGQKGQALSDLRRDNNVAHKNDVNKAGTSGGSVRRQVGRSTRGRKKLDLNVEVSNEVEEHATTATAGNGEDEGIEGIGFFEGLDEFLSTLPILNVNVEDGKSKAS